ncbi:MAG: hypothetical protein VXY94_01295 [Planctomycetota bacterium]|nr:hypothetical protein [Planctomycetota bacterium]MEC8818071.1 hypothetical protein [Planctomycetota bacterium]MEC9157085.1 hypothetical protein [Planctomycetota bacterium]MEC9234380.1 hypothetical protein [Planctomycetota bacterium]
MHAHVPDRAEARDRLARQAARELASTPGLDQASAIARARRHPALADAPSPTRSQVSRHLEALQLQALGEAGFRRARSSELRGIVEVLDLVELLLSPDRIQLAGRIAGPHPLGGVDVHARLVGGRPVESCASELEDAGLEELRFTTARTRHGFLPKASFTGDGRRFHLVSCPGALVLDPPTDLFTGEPIRVLELSELRRSAGVDDDPEVSPGRP